MTGQTMLIHQDLVFVESSAEISECGRYRYLLTRTWDVSLPVLAVTMLNPSKADAVRADPTIRRVMCFARRWGYGGIAVTNLYAWRATCPDDLPADRELAIGPHNQRYLVDAARGRTVLCAWGTRGRQRQRGQEVIELLRPVAKELICLSTTKNGQPEHPLYIPAARLPAKFSVEAA